MLDVSEGGVRSEKCRGRRREREGGRGEVDRIGGSSWIRMFTRRTLGGGGASESVVGSIGDMEGIFNVRYGDCMSCGNLKLET